jgi:MFS transporter, OFA family, oxalate/formate antiporter
MSQPTAETIELPLAEAPVEGSAGIYYGWYMLPMSMAALIASSPGQTFGISIFNEPMRQSLALSHGQLAAAYTLGTIFAAVPITYFGHLMDRQGLRRTMLLVVTLFSLACLATALAWGWFTLVLAFFLLRMLGPGALAFTSGNTLSLWFQRRLGMVEGVRQLGMAAAMAIVPSVNLYLVATWGWRGAYVILGLVIWGALFPLYYFYFRNRPEEVGQTLDGIGRASGEAPAGTAASESTLAETLRDLAFWIVTAGTALFGLVHTAVFFSFVPILTERNLTEADATATLVVFAASLAAAQLVGGLLADRLRVSAMLVPGLFGLAVSMWLLLTASGRWEAYFAGAAMGVSQGIYFGAAHPFWARHFGRRHLGKIRGLMMTINVGASSLGPLIAGTLRDAFGNFDWPLLIFALLPLPLAVLSIVVSTPDARAGSSEA